jgi:murein DD-endopeptidase MepM/ murein hydrolase activator NlpD
VSPARALRAAFLALGLAVLAAPAVGLAQSGPLHDREHALKNELEATREKIVSARAKEQELSGVISTQSDQIAAVRGRIGALGSELDTLEHELTTARGRLDHIRTRLREQSERLALLRGQLGVAQERLDERLVEIYTSDEPDLVSVILGADGLEDLIDQLELYSSVVEQDSRIVDEVKSLRLEVARARARTASLEGERAAQTAALERRTEERRAAYATLVAERDWLASLQADRTQALASIRVERREWEAEADALEAESEQVASLIAAASPPPPSPSPPPPSGGDGGGEGHNHPPTGGSSSSGFIWPVQGTVVSPFGMRWGRLHAGIDIAAPAGTPVVASNSGRVIYAGWMSGYGLIVVVQHAGGLATAYAHNSSVAVGVGQSVARGQRIASVGCTGSCFGNHVHFEVRVNGSPVDPMGYL